MILGDVCLATYPQIKGTNPTGSKPSGERARLVPIRITTDVGTTLAACRTNEPVLDVRQPNVIRPVITVHPDIVTAPIVLTKDQEPANAFADQDGRKAARF